MYLLRLYRLALAVTAAGFVCVTAIKAQTVKHIRPIDNSRRPTIRIPRIERAPTMDDFKGTEGSSVFVQTFNLSHQALVSLETTKNFNYDVLFTYLLHPGTAIYMGYNTNLSTLDPALIAGPNGLGQRPNRYINDGRQIFVKVSYLLRF
jgi:hypothetical protein